MKICINCDKYKRDKDKCNIHGEILSILCCKDFEKKNPTKRKVFSFSKRRNSDT